MKKVIFIFGLFVLIMLSLFLIITFTSQPKKSSEKIKIITTLFPLYDFVKNIGGDKVDVILLLPPGVEPHSFEPKPSDIDAINHADLFVYTGDFMEPWAHDIVNSIDKKVKVVNTSVGIELLTEEKHDREEDRHDDKSDDHYTGVDPHIWLDFLNAQKITDNITAGLIQVDNFNDYEYLKNAKNYKEKLQQLDNDYQEKISRCKDKEIIYGGHYAFGYLAKRYSLDYVAAQGFSPDSEPTANDLVALINQIKNKNIKFIFYEELSSPKIAETLSHETGTAMLMLNGAHNLSKQDFENNVSFIMIMENNLINLLKGLNCEYE